MIAAATVVHVGAHYYNFATIASSELREFQQVFPFLDAQVVPNEFELTFQLLPGWTGHVMVVCMLFMYTSALARIRRNAFEVFWYTHHLFVPFAAAGFAHGFAMLLGTAPKMWIFGAVPVGLYTLERLLRFIRANRPTRISRVIAHPSDVVEIRFEKRPKFSYKTGQYLFLQCPAVSSFEWHPFTISSAPHQSFTSVHVRQTGDFTRRLAAYLVPTLNINNYRFPARKAHAHQIKIDGPYGAATEDIFDYEVVVMVAAGVGVTPFASVLKSVDHWLGSHRGRGPPPFAKGYFFWVAKTKVTFEWFTSLLSELEKEAVAKARVLEIHTYLTEKLSQEEMRQIVWRAKADQRHDFSTGNMSAMSGDAVTGLLSPTHFGRPNWEKVFYQLYKDHAGKRVGVFCCGPGALSKTLFLYCRKFTDNYTLFEFHKENF